MLFNLISSLFLKFSIGLTLLALLADAIQEKYIVTKLKIIDNKIGMIDILNTNPSILLNKKLPSNILTILINTNTANIPDNIPKGIPIIPRSNPSIKTLFLICFLVAQR